MLVSTWMARDALTISPESPIEAAVEKMVHHRIRRLPVVSEGALVGLLSRTDVMRAAPEGMNPFSKHSQGFRGIERPVREIMSSPPITASADTPLEEAARVMVERKIGALPVVRGTALLGIITESDIFRAFIALLGGHDRGVRITFDLSSGEDILAFASSLGKRHALQVAALFTMETDGKRLGVLKLTGPGSAEVLEEIWRSGHKVLSVVRGQHASGGADEK